MRTTFFAVASLAVLSTLGLSVQETQAKSLSNRHQNHARDMLAPAAHRRKACKKHNKKPAHASNSNTKPKNGTTSNNSSNSNNSKPKSGSHSSASSGSSSHASSGSSSHAESGSSHASSGSSSGSSGSSSSSSSSASASAPASSAASASASASAPSASSSSTSSSSPSANAGAAPPNSPWGNCFDLTATAFQPNWKGEATTTWCGVHFDKSAPIIALPLAQLSQAYGSGTSVTYYSNQGLWNTMISQWCGREVIIQGPGGSFKAYFGDANEWTSVDVNMNLFTKLKGVGVGSYVDPDAAGWIHGVKGCFTGQQISLKNGYPFSYN
ncbi:conserved hypothetical protein [Sporisorium reilianum SRZ2]|uniref:Uncharacterized protein n=1 Tax=Sporisorium reilianum (strain SRZ2) TaxID=999809 RepID=E6ZYA8_SPORE|nr:conserved hypothetical protein [Sporisorium reilianum SRZ2]